jgi:hypothetical protein
MRRLLIFAAVVMMIMAMAAPASARSENAPDKVTVCHVTHSVKNPVVVISVGNAAWHNGHDDGFNLRPAKHQNEDEHPSEGC